MNYSKPGTEGMGDSLILPPFPGVPDGLTLESWPESKTIIRKLWNEALGYPCFSDYDKILRAVADYDRDTWTGTLFEQTTGPDDVQSLLVMRPKEAVGESLPGAVVPYYHPDLMAGVELKTLKFAGEIDYSDKMAAYRWAHFARHFVERGYVVVCHDAFPYHQVPELHKQDIPWPDIWRLGAEKLLAKHPNWTGMGKLIHDTRRALDVLLDQPNVDPHRIVAMGHSLGGKMAFNAGAHDERIKAVIASDFGIGWNYSNWNSLWYYGERINNPAFSLGNHHLLALMAPDPFFLIGGRDDKPQSWRHLIEAGKIYKLFGVPDNIRYFYHGTGHPPVKDALIAAYQFVDEWFNLVPRDKDDLMRMLV